MLEDQEGMGVICVLTSTPAKTFEFPGGLGRRTCSGFVGSFGRTDLRPTSGDLGPVQGV